MTGTEWLALAAVVLCALAVLPGTLGVLMFTHKIAADSKGARYIYGGTALGGLLLSVVLMAIAIYQALPIRLLPITGLPLVLVAEVMAYGGILVFGFFMHTTRNFRPVRQPIFISMDEAVEKFGPDEEVVGVIDATGTPYAFVTRLARRPHIVYQAKGEAPFLMTHCILAHSSMAYAMEGKFANPDISITAVLANNMVFYEKTNKCSVIQLHNQTRDGDIPLQTVPTVSVKLKTWQALYPESRVWIRHIEWRDIFYLKLLARADVIDPASPVMVYPLSHPLDARQPMKSTVLGVDIDGQSKTYPTSLFPATRVINDELGGTPLLVAAAQEGDFIQVYDRRLDDDATLTFEAVDRGDNFTDRETGSLWAPTGLCISGTHEGRTLKPIAHYNKIFWYVWSDFHHGTAIHAETPAGDRHVA